MGKKSDDQRNVEIIVDELLLRKTLGNDTDLHIVPKTEQSMNTTLELRSDSSQKKKEKDYHDYLEQHQQDSDFLSDLNEKYRLIALNTSDLISFTTFDMNPTFTFVSPSHEKNLGYTENDLLGQPGLNFIHKDDAEAIVSLLVTYLEAKMNNTLTPDMLTTGQNINFRFLDKTGQWHFLQSTVNIVKDELLFISKDITEQKRAQEALINSERKYRTLYDNLRDGFAAVDLNGKITECNTAFVNMIGYSLPETYSLTYKTITPLRWHDFENKILNEQVKKRGYSDLYEKEYIRKNGTIFPVELQTYAVYDSENTHCGYWAFIRDITIRKKMDLEQQENQERIKAIVMNAPIGIAVVGPNAHFMSANDAFCKILGYSEKELQSMSFKDITHSDDFNESRKLVDDLKEGKISSFQVEKRYIKKDKSVIFGKVIVSMIRSQQDAPSLYIAELEDITSRKLMDEALKKSEEKFVKAFRSSPVAIAITQISDGRFLEVNKSLEKLIGYTRDELLSQTTIGLNIWADSNDRKCLFEELGKTGSVYDHEYRFLSKNHKIIYTRYSGEVIDFSGEQAVLSVLIDITDSKKAEELLRESEEKYRGIVENSQDIIMLTNPDGRVGYISPACVTILGYQPDEIIGKIPEIFYSDDIKKVNSTVLKALQGISGTNFEYRIVTKKGEIRWVSHSWATILNESHEIRYIVSVVRDITDIKIAEQNLKMKIEELEKYKSVTINREIKMVELKHEINEFCKQLNLKPKYQEN